MVGIVWYEKASVCETGLRKQQNCAKASLAISLESYVVLENRKRNV